MNDISHRPAVQFADRRIVEATEGATPSADTILVNLRERTVHVGFRLINMTAILKKDVVPALEIERQAWLAWKEVCKGRTECTRAAILAEEEAAARKEEEAADSAVVDPKGFVTVEGQGFHMGRRLVSGDREPRNQLEAVALKVWLDYLARAEAARLAEREAEAVSQEGKARAGLAGQGGAFGNGDAPPTSSKARKSQIAQASRALREQSKGKPGQKPQLGGGKSKKSTKTGRR